MSVEKYVHSAVKWGTAAAATKIAFDVAVTPLINFLSSTAANIVQNPLMEIVTADELVPHVRKQLARDCIIVLGAKGVGKTSLVRYLAHGSPIKGRANSSLSDPSITFSGVIVVNEVNQALWKRIIERSRPTGIIYMVDPRGGKAALGPELAQFRSWLLEAYSNGAPPKTIHVLLNFADKWAESASSRLALTRYVEDTLSAELARTRGLSASSLGVVAIQLSPESKQWPEVRNAVDHLGADLGR